VSEAVDLYKGATLPSRKLKKELRKVDEAAAVARRARSATERTQFEERAARVVHGEALHGLGMQGTARLDYQARTLAGDDEFLLRLLRTTHVVDHAMTSSAVANGHTTGI
jgi:hypothetical protein